MTSLLRPIRPVRGSRLPFRPALPLFALAFLAATPAFAHEAGELTDGTAWSSWNLTPDIVIPTLLVALVYAVGLLRRRTGDARLPWWRPLLFFSGLAAVFLSLQSPVDPIAEHLFSVHQLQHLMLRMIGPMLIVLAWPEGVLNAGLRTMFGRNILKPLAAARPIRGIFRVLADPVVATALFIAALYVWEIPAFHDTAILDEGVHYVMHATMLAAGLLFWWRIFDRRPAPQGLRYGVRLMILWVVALSNILLGSYTTLKQEVLYTAYDATGRLFGYSAIGDEQLGGFIIWIPGAMMSLIGVLIVVHMWGRQEAQTYARQGGAEAVDPPYPVSGAAMVRQQAPKNRALAIGVSTFVAAVFVLAITVGILSEHGVPATATDAPAIRHAMHEGSTSSVR